MLDKIYNKKNLKDQLLSLKRAISESKVITPREICDFVFLCGANIDDDTISERRSALMAFAKEHLPRFQFFLAEKVLPILKKEGHKGNILDIENEISVFADKIIIVLESASTFTELGAFSHKELRQKLIVINDSKFKTSKSFINEGPIEAIKEVSGENQVIYYKMRGDGVRKLDSIGDIYSPLYEILNEKKRRRIRPSPITFEECNPGINFNKKSVMMVHDLIYFSGPIKYDELIRVLLLIFGQASYNKLKAHTAFLVATESLIRAEDDCYRSRLDNPYYNYKFDFHSLISVYRNYLLKFCPERFNGN